jgi:molybdate/tungstate transport system permease protein
VVDYLRFTFTVYILGTILLLYTIIPLVGVAFRVAPMQLGAALARSDFLSSFLLSVETATISTSIIAVTGIPLGYLISRIKSKISDILRIGMAIPLVIPPLIAGTLLLNVYGTSSPVGSLAQSIGFPLSQSLFGIILAQVFVASPFVVLTSSAAFDKVDRQYEYVSRSLGKGEMTTLIRVTLPLAARGIIAGLLLAWVRAVGELGATIIMAYNPKTVSIQLWEHNAIGGLNLVMPEVVIVIFVTFILLLIWALFSSSGKRGNWLV